MVFFLESASSGMVRCTFVKSVQDGCVIV